VSDVIAPIQGHTHGFYYHAGGVSSLSSITVNDQNLVDQPRNINNFGIIAGNASSPNPDQWRPWLWFPIP